MQINGEDVTTALHEHVVDLIRKSGELVRMTVVSPVFGLPNAQSAGVLPTSQPLSRQFATLPRKGSNTVIIGGTLGRSPAPAPPRRDPKTTLSVGRARARSMVAGLGIYFFIKKITHITTENSHLMFLFMDFRHLKKQF